LKKITFITLLYQAFRLDSSDFSSRIQVKIIKGGAKNSI